MKTTLYSIVLILVTSWLFSACSESETSFSEQLTMVPVDAAIVVDIDMERLGAMITPEQLKNSSFLEVLGEKSDTAFIHMLCSDTKESGIETSDLLIFVLDDKQIGIALELSDATKFETWFKNMMLNTDITLDIKIVDEVKSCSIKEHDHDIFLLWNENKALILSATDMDKGLALFNQGTRESIISDKEFKSFYADKKDMSVWMDMESYFRLVGNTNKFRSMGFPMIEEYKDLYTGMHSTYNIEFLDGAVRATGKVIPLNKAKQISKMYYKEEQSKELLSAVPANSFLLFSAAMNISEFIEIYKSFPQFKELLENPETAEIVNSIDGDMVLSISDFASGPLPIPNAVIGLSVEDETILEAISTINGVQKIDKDGYTALLVSMFQLYVAQKDNLLLLSTNEEVIKSFAAGESLEDNLLNSKHKDKVESSVYYYVNLNLDNYPDAIKGLLKGKMGNGYDTLAQSMRFEDLVSSYEHSTCEYEITLNMKNKDTNSLSALFDMIDVVFSMQ